MGLRDRLRRLERLSEGEMIVIPQRDGTIKKFPQPAGREAFMNLMDRLGAGEDAPPEHPLIEAVRNSSDPKWSRSFFAVNDPDGWTKPVEDLSEP
jgi:hypothetical protein